MIALVLDEEEVANCLEMNRKGNAAARNGHPDSRHSRRGNPAATAFKALRLVLSTESAMPWRPGPASPGKHSRSPAQLPRHIYSSNRPSRPTAPGSNPTPCGKRGFSGLRFDGVRVAQSASKAGSGPSKNPIYVLFCLCLFAVRVVKRSDNRISGRHHEPRRGRRKRPWPFCLREFFN